MANAVLEIQILDTATLDPLLPYSSRRARLAGVSGTSSPSVSSIKVSLRLKCLTHKATLISAPASTCSPCLAGHRSPGQRGRRGATFPPLAGTISLCKQSRRRLLRRESRETAAHRCFRESADLRGARDNTGVLVLSRVREQLGQ